MESFVYKDVGLTIYEDDEEFAIDGNPAVHDISEWFGYDRSKTTKTNVLNAVDWGHITKDSVHTDDSELQSFIREARKRPRDFGWFGDDKMFDTWGFIGIGTHRDADALVRSNFEVIKKDLEEKFGDDVEVVGCSHWAVGWTEGLRGNLQNVALCHAVMQWHGALESYPVADDEHYSLTESDERQEAIENWGRQEALKALVEFGFMLEDDELIQEELEVLDRIIEHEMQDYGECYFSAEVVADKFANDWECQFAEVFWNKKPWKRAAIIDKRHEGDDFDVYIFEAGNGMVWLDEDERRYESFHHLFDDALPEKVKMAAKQLRDG